MLATKKTRLKYGLEWDSEFYADDLRIELEMIKKGGSVKNARGQTFGIGLFEHFMEARSLAWPSRYRHEWTELMYREFIQNDVTILLGAASTNKTSTACEYVLLRYWSDPHNTFVPVSTIEVDKLETGVFGEVKMLWTNARNLHPWLAGNLIDHKKCIATDNIEEVEARDLRKGIMGRACRVGGKWVGLGKLIGTKQKNIIYLCDELQFMAPTFLASWTNLFSNGNVKIIGSGNPKHDPDDQLGLAAEPKEGWPSIPEPQVTTTWETRFMNARCVNLVGTDSPNFRAVAKGLDEPYPGLIGPKFVNRIAHDNGLNSPEYYGQAKGVMRLDMVVKRVLTRQLCREHGASEKAIWSGKPRTIVYGLDPSYGGPDLCWRTILEFGESTENKPIIRVALSSQIVINLALKLAPEDQIALAVKEDLDKWQIPIQNAGYDPYGKGTMGFALAQVFGNNCPIPVDSGGKPTQRPVRQGLYVDEPDGHRRLKRCDEHYVKFVTEAWFSVRYTVQANQMRELPEEVIIEGCSRQYDDAPSSKIELETKDDLKERGVKSPNKFDSLTVALEMARRRGFEIGQLGNAVVLAEDEDDFFETEAREWKEALQKQLLKH